MFERNEALFKISLKDMAMKTFDCQLKLMTLVMVYVAICARGNFPNYCSKATGIDLHNLAVAGVSGPHCENNIKRGNEIYAAHLLFTQ